MSQQAGHQRHPGSRRGVPDPARQDLQVLSSILSTTRGESFFLNVKKKKNVIELNIY